MRPRPVLSSERKRVPPARPPVRSPRGEGGAHAGAGRSLSLAPPAGRRPERRGAPREGEGAAASQGELRELPEVGPRGRRAREARERWPRAHLRPPAPPGSPAGSGPSGRCSTARGRGRWTGRIPRAATTPTPRAPSRPLRPAARRGRRTRRHLGAASLGRLFLGEHGLVLSLCDARACCSVKNASPSINDRSPDTTASDGLAAARTLRPRAGQRATPAARG